MNMKIFLGYLGYIFTKILDSAAWAGYLGATLGWIASFLIPIRDFILITSFLVILDLITGVLAASRRKEKIRSRALMRTTGKLLLYYCAVLASHSVEEVFVNNIPITYFTAFTISITEFKSVLENVGAGTGTKLSRLIIEYILKRRK